jgi:hypothetical protein
MTSLKVVHIDEPWLEFRYGQKLYYPRDGLFLYGPVDGGRLEVHYGAIGTPAGVARLQQWAQTIGGFLPPPLLRHGARAVEPQHVAFPGFAAAFNAAWSSQPRTTITTIDQQALSRALHIANRHEAIKAAVDLYVTPLFGYNCAAGGPAQLLVRRYPRGSLRTWPSALPCGRQRPHSRRSPDDEGRSPQAQSRTHLVWSRRSGGRHLPLCQPLPASAEGAAACR